MGNPIKWGGAEQGITQDALVPSVTLNLSIMSSRSFSEIKCCNELVSASAAPDGISNLSRHENGRGKQNKNSIRMDVLKLLFLLSIEEKVCALDSIAEYTRL